MNGRVKNALKIFGLLAFILVVILFASVNDGPTVGQQLLENIRVSFGMSAEEVRATSEMQTLVESGIPEGLIYAYSYWGRTYPELLDLYPVASNTTLLIPVPGDYGIITGVRNVSWGADAAGKLPTTLKLDSADDGKSVKIQFGNISEEYYHRTFEIPSIKIDFNYERQRNQINVLKGSNKRFNIVFYVVSKSEMETLDRLHSFCKRKLCNIQEDLMH